MFPSKRTSGEAPINNQKKYPFCAYILYKWIPKSLEKPLKLNEYEGKGDPEDHVHHVDDSLNYYHVDEAAKRKLFALILT